MSGARLSVRAARPEPGFGLRAAVASGLLWAILVTVSENMSELTRELDLRGYLQAFGGLGLYYACGGILMSIVAVRIEARMSGWRAWAAGAGTIAAATLLHMVLHFGMGRLWPGMGAQAMFVFVPDLRDYVAILCWVSWVHVIYGGAYMGALVLFLRSARRHRQLRRSAQARLRAELRVEQALAEDRTRLVQPTLVLEALGELGRRYRVDADRADELLDALVLFLRSAIAGGAQHTPELVRQLEPALRQLVTGSTPSSTPQKECLS
jgi:hypothetical protein